MAPKGRQKEEGLPGSLGSGAQKGGVAASGGVSASASPSRGWGAGRLLAFERSLEQRLSSCSLAWTPSDGPLGGPGGADPLAPLIAQRPLADAAPLIS